MNHLLKVCSKQSAAVLLVALSPLFAQASSLFAPFTFDSGDVLPKGVGSVRVLGFTTEMEERWDGSSGFEPLGAKFNKGITYRELIGAQKSVDERAQLKGYLVSNGVSMDAELGVTRGIVNTRLTSTVPVMAYGLTDKLTVAVIVPVVYSNINVSAGWSSNEGFQGVLDGLSKSGMHAKKLSFGSQLQNVVHTQLAAFGYQPLTNESHREIGDVTLGTKYLLFRDKDWSVTLSSRVVLPTGRAAGTDKLIDISAGDGQWDAGIGATAEYRIIPKLSALGTVSALYQFSSSRARRVPIQPGQRATPDIDFNTNEKLGDIGFGMLGLKYTPFELWTFTTQYSLQYRGPDVYSGSAFARERYEWMSDETEQELYSLQGGVTFSTVPLYKTGVFAVPFETTLSVASTVGGRNAGKATLAAWEVAMFF